MALRRTPFFHAHERAGARLVDFAGWEMPVSYQGTIAEHRQVREQAQCFALRASTFALRPSDFVLNFTFEEAMRVFERIGLLFSVSREQFECLKELICVFLQSIPVQKNGSGSAAACSPRSKFRSASRAASSPCLLFLLARSK